MVCVALIVLLAAVAVGGTVVAYIYSQVRLQRQLQGQLAAAQRAYKESLAKLKSDPNNPALRQRVLRLGRAYSMLTRDDKNVTIYDEAALKNDIDAACAGAVSVQNRSIEERLAKLQRLLQDGHISEEEYSRRRQRILDEV
jgi:Short C-terminal domain